MAASNAASCVRAGASWGASARGERSEFLLFRDAWGFVMSLSAIRTQHCHQRNSRSWYTGGSDQTGGHAEPGADQPSAETGAGLLIGAPNGADRPEQQVRKRGSTDQDIRYRGTGLVVGELQIGQAGGR